MIRLGSLLLSGVVALAALGVVHREPRPMLALAIAVGAMLLAVILPASSRIASAVSASTTSARAGSACQSFGASKTSFRTKRMSRSGAW